MNQFQPIISYKCSILSLFFNQKHLLLLQNLEFYMQSQVQRNTQFMITKEVFIDHIPSDIQLHYEVSSNCLGQGGFGKVFQGRKKRKLNGFANKDILGNNFLSSNTNQFQEQNEQNRSEFRAIKQINFQQQKDKQTVKNQIQILSYLDHPSIVKLYETYEHKKQLYLVTDLLKGGDLFTVIDEQKQVSEQNVKAIFKQLIKAVNYLHSQHICHRDLKLQNILFLDSDSCNIKLIDFGLAFCWDQDMKKQLRKTGQNKKIAGTADYLAPEILLQNYDQRCDIWSAGVILYILLSKTPPFFGNSDKEIMQKIKNIDYTFQIPEFQNISELAKDVILKILKPQNQRIALSQILSHQWFKEAARPYIESLQRTPLLTGGIKGWDSISQAERKFLSTRSFGRLNRIGSSKVDENCKLSLEYENSQPNTDCISQLSGYQTFQDRAQQLTVQKLQHYSRLTKLQKVFVICSVSKLSSSKTKSYDHEFSVIDRDNDGTISLSDLTAYLQQGQNFLNPQRTQHFFNDLSLSQRDCISYTEYLACVLSFQSSCTTPNYQQLQFDQRFTFSGKSLFLAHEAEQIDLYHDDQVFQLFSMLDTDRDGRVGRIDFVQLLQDNGIMELNYSLLESIGANIFNLNQYRHHFAQETDESLGEQIDQAFEEQTDDKFSKKTDDTFSKKTDETLSKKTDETFEWQEDPRKFKLQLSRTYKGGSDGGTHINFKQFKHLIKIHDRCSQ